MRNDAVYELVVPFFGQHNMPWVNVAIALPLFLEEDQSLDDREPQPFQLLFSEMLLPLLPLNDLLLQTGVEGLEEYPDVREHPASQVILIVDEAADL